jgi:hypothetical protein
LATHQYTIYNKCPNSIDLYIAGVRDSTIPTGGNVVKNLDSIAGFFYTTANGGSHDAVGTIRAGFYDMQYYYIVADPDHANTRLQVKPKSSSSNGFCETVQCDGRGCPQGFSQPPTRFPNPASTPPPPPYYRCRSGNTGYDITFCPTGVYPNLITGPIHFNYQDKCLDVKGADFSNGTVVQIYDCNGSDAQRWVIKRGSTKVRVWGTSMCLDAGTTPANGTQLKIWQCFADLPAQQWVYTGDNRIALENQGFCVDLEYGITKNGNKVQTWQCSDGNQNQVWTL